MFYATGLGVTTPSIPSGSGGSGSPPYNLVSVPFDVYIGNSKASVAWAGLAPGFVGVYQVNVVPSAEAIGDLMITCATCSESNHVHMPQGPLNGGNNITNATGSVTIVYPTGQPTMIFSPGFVVAKVTARFDIKPTADRFTVSVTGKIGTTSIDGTTIQFDPVLGQFTATIPSPTPAVRTLDFSRTGITVLDFRPGSCGTQTTCPMPGNIVPISLFDPRLLTALNSVPVPNSPSNGIHSFYTVTGTFTPGSTFVMDGSNNLDLLVFASIGSIPYPTADVPVSVILSIDGQIGDATTTTYKHP